MSRTCYTPDEVAQQLRVARRTVYEWLRTGRLRGLRAGRAWRIRDEDLMAFLGEHPMPEESPVEPSSAEQVPRGSHYWDTYHEPLHPRDPVQAKKNEGARRLLRQWLEEGDEEEQRETLEFLMKALDEDRPSYRKLFP